MDMEPLSLTKPSSTNHIVSPKAKVNHNTDIGSTSSYGADIIKPEKHNQLELPPIVPRKISEEEEKQRSVIDLRRERVIKKKKKNQTGKEEVKKEELEVKPVPEVEPQHYNTTIHYTAGKDHSYI